jgi:hypothetical protein
MKTTNKQIKDLLPGILKGITDAQRERPDLILAAWPGLIGDKLAPMTKATAFTSGILIVKVNNSTLYSLLKTQERMRLLLKLREQFPAAHIKNIDFRIG